mmetsp:Transcript_13535/g.13272  ORF Transcript_13535/g.13272 Transcript_13535/m.13272 type:complete len:91 (+) Transcript_13535:485-757(+)
MTKRILNKHPDHAPHQVSRLQNLREKLMLMKEQGSPQFSPPHEKPFQEQCCQTTPSMINYGSMKRSDSNLNPIKAFNQSPTETPGQAVKT